MAEMKLLQKRAAEQGSSLQRKGGKSLADNRSSSPQVAQLADKRKASPINRTGLPSRLKGGVEALSGMSMDHVRVHYNSAKPAQMQAHAYAQGNQIHLGPGQEKHLPHEAWHVVQQAQGRVKPTMQMKAGVAVNDDNGLEKEADVMGRRAAQLAANGHSEIFSRPPSVTQLACVKCKDEGEAVQRQGIVQRITDCAASNHPSTFQHRWVQKKYIDHFGGVREYHFTYGYKGPSNYVDIVDGKEVYEIKPNGQQATAKAEAEDYVQKLNEVNYGCSPYNFILGKKFSGSFDETGFGYKFKAWSPEDGVILYSETPI